MAQTGFSKDEEEEANPEFVIGGGRRQSMKPPLNKSKSIITTEKPKPFQKMDEIMSISRFITFQAKKRAV